MAHAPPFDIKLPDGKLVHFDQDVTFENFVGQFQAGCPKLLCVVDGTVLRHYDRHGALPKNIRFDYKQVRNGIVEYYFRDIGTDSLYCVFGRDPARIFYPRIDEVDPEPASEPISTSIANTSVNTKVIPAVPITVSSTTPLHITIIDSGLTLKFPNPDYTLEVRTHSIF
jgi:hypothetical protein